VLRRTRPDIIRDLLRTVGERGGLCHTTELQGRTTRVELDCGKGHRWWARAGNILDGSWCPACGRASTEALWMARFGLVALDDADEVALWAEARGLIHVQHGKLRLGRVDFYQCSAGHLWEASRAYPWRPEARRGCCRPAALSWASLPW
jgi:hypothetical protein